DVRGGERRRDHRRRGVLAHALDRDPGLSLARAQRSSRRGRFGRRGLDVVARDRAVRAGRGDVGEVDAERLRELAYRRLRRAAVAGGRAGGGGGGGRAGRRGGGEGGGGGAGGGGGGGPPRGGGGAGGVGGGAARRSPRAGRSRRGSSASRPRPG